MSDEEREERLALGEQRWVLEQGRGVLVIRGSDGEVLGAIAQDKANQVGLKAGMVISILPVHHEGEVA